MVFRKMFFLASNISCQPPPPTESLAASRAADPRRRSARVRRAAATPDAGSPAALSDAAHGGSPLVATSLEVGRSVRRLAGVRWF